MIELVLFLLIVGILFLSVIKGQELIKNAKAKAFHSRLMELHLALLRYYDMQGRWPGDCNRDGTIKAWVNFYVPNEWDFRADTNPTPGSCQLPDNNAAPEADYDTPFSDMRLAGILPPQIPNREIAKHPFGHYFAIGFAGIDWNTNQDLPNVIVAYNIPIWAARMVDVMIDGSINSTSGRVRKTGISNAPDYEDLSIPENNSTHIIYFFERPQD